MPIARSCLLAILSIGLLSSRVWSADESFPTSIDSRLKIELFAESPQIVTPTGIDVDHAGRVWAIESNTHFPPEGYQGHPTDRVLVMQGRQVDGKVEKITVFKDGLVHTMSIAVKPVWLDLAAKGPHSPPLDKLQTTEVFIATRREILLCTDVDGDLKCDDVKTLVHLETNGNYPHNGLAGFAFHADGSMYFGFGENLGADYKIIGSDGTSLSGGGEGGNIYRCQPDGSKLERWATGFWNPHASCFDALGRMFTLDNDPDSRPPCRLLHIVRGGDYGYRFRNGRKGTHPFTAWNGEIPGTLPMVSGTGEAPSGIVCYESDGFPDDYFGNLLVGSWGDHRIDRFVLKPRGESFESVPQPFIKGGENFRPVGLAIAPDGSLFVTDWVSKEYKLHGLGRVWRISAKDEPKREVIDPLKIGKLQYKPTLHDLMHSHRLDIRRTTAHQAVNSGHRDWFDQILASQAKELPSLANRNQFELTQCTVRPAVESDSAEAKRAQTGWPMAERYFRDHDRDDPFAMAHALNAYSIDDASESWFVDRLTDQNWGGVRWRVVFLGLTARRLHPKSESIPKLLVSSHETFARRLGVQWIGEEYLKGLRSDVEQVLVAEPMTAELFMACLASLSLLDGVAPFEFEKNPPVHYALSILTDGAKPTHLRAIAIRMIPPSQKELDGKLLGELVTSSDVELRRETVRTLQLSTIPERAGLLSAIADNSKLEPGLRADAIAGLAASGHGAKLDDATRDLLVKLASARNDLEVRLEAIRSLRGVISSGPQATPSDAKAAEALRALAATPQQEPELPREKIQEAVEFALGSRKSASTSKLMTGIEQLGSHNPDAREQSGAAADAGRRTFFHVNGAGCYKCHMIGGRGGQIGPDLTVIARTMNRKKLAESILIPSKEISPQFTSWSIETTQGKVVTGMLLGEEINGDLRLGTSQGELVYVPFKDVESRTPLKTSVMPERLQEMMSTGEFRDLLSFLETLK